MNIRIVSDGGVNGTRVFHAESGQPVRGVRAVRFNHEAQGAPSVEVDICSVTADVEGVAHWYVSDPATGEPKQVRRVEFADGTEWAAEDG